MEVAPVVGFGSAPQAVPTAQVVGFDSVTPTVITTAVTTPTVITTAVTTAPDLPTVDDLKEFALGLLTPGKDLLANEELKKQAGIQAKAMYLLKLTQVELLGQVTLTPPTPVPSFRLYNTLGFWLYVVEALVILVKGGLGAMILSDAVAFAVSFALYWVVTCAQPSVPNVKMYQFAAIIFIGAYAAFNVYTGVNTLVYLLPAVLYFAKALCSVLMLINAYPLCMGGSGDTHMV